MIKQNTFERQELWNRFLFFVLDAINLSSSFNKHTNFFSFKILPQLVNTLWTHGSKIKTVTALLVKLAGVVPKFAQQGPISTWGEGGGTKTQSHNKGDRLLKRMLNVKYSLKILGFCLQKYKNWRFLLKKICEIWIYWGRFEKAGFYWGKLENLGFSSEYLPLLRVKSNRSSGRLTVVWITYFMDSWWNWKIFPGGSLPHGHGPLPSSWCHPAS